MQDDDAIIEQYGSYEAYEAAGEAEVKADFGMSYVNAGGRAEDVSAAWALHEMELAERYAEQDAADRVGDAGQWARVEDAAWRGGRDAERAYVARRDAAMFGTDPSWFGF